MILSVWLCYMSFECIRLLELHSFVSVASWMSHHQLSQTAVSYSSQFLAKKADPSVAVAVFVRNLRIGVGRRSS